MMRYFRTSDGELYERVRKQLDAAWGHVAPETCITPIARAPLDQDGAVVLAVDDAFCEYEAVAEILPSLLASGAVQEIEKPAYMSAVSATP